MNRDQPSQPAGGFAKSPKPSMLSKGSSAQVQLCSRSSALQAAEQLAGCFKRDDTANPDVFMASVARIFMQFPGWVAWLAADPLKGLAKEEDWLPSLAKIHAYCNRVHGEHQGERERAKALNAQLDERKRLPSPEDYPEHREAVVEKRLKQLGEHFGIEQPADKAVSIPPLETVMAKYPGGVMAGLKLSPETMKTMAVQETFRRLREAETVDDEDPD